MSLGPLGRSRGTDRLPVPVDRSGVKVSPSPPRRPPLPGSDGAWAAEADVQAHGSGPRCERVPDAPARCSGSPRCRAAPSSTQLGLSSGSISMRYVPDRVAAGGGGQLGRRDDPVGVGRHLDRAAPLGAGDPEHETLRPGRRAGDHQQAELVELRLVLEGGKVLDARASRRGHPCRRTRRRRRDAATGAGAGAGARGRSAGRPAP